MENPLSILLFLACPIGMALMMWLMQGHHQSSSESHPDDAEAPLNPSPPPTNTIGRLRQYVAHHVGAKG